MRKTLAVLALLLATVSSLFAAGVNITNYPQIHSAVSNDWFFMTRASAKTNLNFSYGDLVNQLNNELNPISGVTASNVSAGVSNQWRIDSTNISTFISANLATSPFVECYTNGRYFANGQWHTAVSNVIQEAINALPYDPTKRGGGGTVRLGPGWFYITNGLTLPYTTNGYNFDLEGAGLSGSGIIYAGSTDQSALTIGYPGTFNSYVFLLKDLFIASARNTCTNVVTINGNSTNIAGIAAGGIGRGIINSCWIGYWGSMTNNVDQPFTPSHDPDTMTKHNLTGIYVDCQYDDTISIELCSFSYLGTAIRWACDHGVIANNCFETCGVATAPGVTTLPNDWAHNLPQSIGPAVLLQNPLDANGSEHITAHNYWLIYGNNFIGCPVHYCATMFPGTFAANVVVREDTTEYTGPGHASAVTLGAKFSFVDPKWYLANDPNQWQISAYLVTDQSDWTTYTNHPDDGTLVTIADSLQRTNTGNYSFGGDLIAKNFIGGGGGLSGVNAVIATNSPAGLPVLDPSSTLNATNLAGTVNPLRLPIATITDNGVSHPDNSTIGIDGTGKMFAFAQSTGAIYGSNVQGAVSSAVGATYATNLASSINPTNISSGTNSTSDIGIGSLYVGTVKPTSSFIRLQTNTVIGWPSIGDYRSGNLTVNGNEYVGSAYFGIDPSVSDLSGMGFGGWYFGYGIDDDAGPIIWNAGAALHNTTFLTLRAGTNSSTASSMTLMTWSPHYTTNGTKHPYSANDSTISASGRGGLSLISTYAPDYQAMIDFWLEGSGGLQRAAWFDAYGRFWLTNNGILQTSVTGSNLFIGPTSMGDVRQNSLFVTNTAIANAVIGTNISFGGLAGIPATGADAVGSTAYIDAANGTGAGHSGNLVFRTSPETSIVSYDNSSAGMTTNSATLSWQHTMGSGPDGILLVGVFHNDTVEQASSVTYGSQSLTLLTKNLINWSYLDLELWYLTSPNSGTGTITVTLPSTETKWFYGISESFTNVQQTSPFGAISYPYGYANSTTQALIPIVTSTNQIAVDFVAAFSQGPFSSPGSSQTNLFLLRTNTAGLSAASSITTGTAGTVTNSYYINFAGTGQIWKGIGVSLQNYTPISLGVMKDQLTIDTSGNASLKNGYFSGSAAGLSNYPVATASVPGVVKPDNSTCTVDGAGTLTIIGGGTNGGFGGISNGVSRIYANNALTGFAPTNLFLWTDSTMSLWYTNSSPTQDVHVTFGVNTIPGSKVTGNISGQAGTVASIAANSVSSGQVTTGLGFNPLNKAETNNLHVTQLNIGTGANPLTLFSTNGALEATDSSAAPVDVYADAFVGVGGGIGSPAAHFIGSGYGLTNFNTAALVASLGGTPFFTSATNAYAVSLRAYTDAATNALHTLEESTYFKLANTNTFAQGIKGQLAITNWSFVAGANVTLTPTVTGTNVALTIASTATGGSGGFTNGNMGGISLTNGNNLTITGTLDCAGIIVRGTNPTAYFNSGYFTNVLTASNLNLTGPFTWNGTNFTGGSGGSGNTYAVTNYSVSLASAGSVATNVSGTNVNFNITIPPITEASVTSVLSGPLQKNITGNAATVTTLTKTQITNALAAPNDASKYLDGTGAFSTPAGTGAGASLSANQTFTGTNTFSQVIIANGGIQTPPGGTNLLGLTYVTNLTVVSSMTNSSLTASRMAMTDTNKAMVSAAASGAVPIDADGSATTASQLTNLIAGVLDYQNLANKPSGTMTEAQITNTLHSPIYKDISGNAATATRPVFGGNDSYQLLMIGTTGLFETNNAIYYLTSSIAGMNLWNDIHGNAATVSSISGNSLTLAQVTNPITAGALNIAQIGGAGTNLIVAGSALNLGSAQVTGTLPSSKVATDLTNNAYTSAQTYAQSVTNSAANLVAAIGTTAVARATGDGSGNSISATYASLTAAQIFSGTNTFTLGNRTFTHDDSHTVITNTSSLTATEWTSGQRKEWYNGSTTMVTDKTNGYVQLNGLVWNTNLNNGVVLDPTKSYQHFTTNATYTISGFSPLVSGQHYTVSLLVSNANNATIYVTNPANCNLIGPISSNYVSIATAKQGYLSFDIYPNSVTNTMNAVQQ